MSQLPKARRVLNNEASTGYLNVSF